MTRTKGAWVLGNQHAPTSMPLQGSAGCCEQNAFPAKIPSASTAPLLVQGRPTNTAPWSPLPQEPSRPVAANGAARPHPGPTLLYRASWDTLKAQCWFAPHVHRTRSRMPQRSSPRASPALLPAAVEGLRRPPPGTIDLNDSWEERAGRGRLLRVTSTRRVLRASIVRTSVGEGSPAPSGAPRLPSRPRPYAVGDVSTPRVTSRSNMAAAVD